MYKIYFTSSSLTLNLSGHHKVNIQFSPHWPRLIDRHRVFVPDFIQGSLLYLIKNGFSRTHLKTIAQTWTKANCTLPSNKSKRKSMYDEAHNHGPLRIGAYKRELTVSVWPVSCLVRSVHPRAGKFLCFFAFFYIICVKMATYAAYRHIELDKVGYSKKRWVFVCRGC